MSYMIGVDVGGTFTDFSVFNQETGELFNYKDSSTPADPSRAIVKGVQDVLEIKKAAPEEVSYLAHGTTVGTNALIEKKGCRLGLITTKGFKDLMEIGTQRRPSLYNLQAQKPYPLVPSGLNCTVTERIRYDGSVETPLDENETREVVRYLVLCSHSLIRFMKKELKRSFMKSSRKHTLRFPVNWHRSSVSSAV